MEFVYKDLGYKKEQVLHSTIYLDEKTPHIHCVVIQLVKKYDKRTNTERYTISKKQYIQEKIHLSELQDKYHKRLTDKGFDLERGIKNSDNVNLKIKEYKRITRKLNNELNTKNQRLNKSMEVFEEKMKTTKNVPFNKTHLLIEKETYYFNKNNEELEKENRSLKDYLEAILEAIKRFFREILLFGDEKSKEATVTEIKDYCDNDDFTKRMLLI